VSTSETFNNTSETQEKAKPSSIKPKVRLKLPERAQVEMCMQALDDLLPDDHKARFIWDYVSQLNLNDILNKIKSIENSAGRSATDPRILLSLWILAITEGIGSARMIERYCSEHNAFKWICGGVHVNNHTLSDFRVDHGEELDNLLTQTIAILMHSGLVTLKRVSQDGMKVKANAGKGSFKKAETLDQYIKISQEQIKSLNEELHNDSSACSARVKAAKKRAAEDRLSRLIKSKEELEKYLKQKSEALKRERKKLSKKQIKDTKSSTTDPETRKMQMNNKGYSPAYNVQLATDHKKGAIVGTNVTNNATDYGQLTPMLEQIKERYGRTPDETLADAGYFSHQDIERATHKNDKCTLYVSPKNKDSHKTTKNKSKVIIDLEQRMNTPIAKEVYSERAGTAELSNAINRNRGLTQFFVRGLNKVKCIVSLFAITHNILIAYYN
jgi:transposase